MNSIKVVDAMMGRGKSTAAIRYINENKRSKRFMYITPFLSEVARIRDQCVISEPEKKDEEDSKLSELCALIYQGKSVSTTHALYQMIDDDLLDVIREKEYTLIIDETITAIDKVQITIQDRCILDTLMTVAEDGSVSWNDSSYSGKFNEYKDMADRHTLYMVDGVLINTFNRSLLSAFHEVFLLTYLFKGSVLEAYFNCFGLPYEIYGIEDTPSGPMFVDHPDNPPPIDYRPLIHIVEKKSMNEIGDPYHALAKNWYKRRSYHDESVTQLRRNMHNFFKNITKSSRNTRLWTCFIDHSDKLIPDNKSYSKNFLQMKARATNEFSECTDLAYMVNRFEDPNLIKFLADRGCEIDQNQCALSDMLQWLWRSAIRNGGEINLYIPSRRMRGLLTDWMERTAIGGAVNG